MRRNRNGSQKRRERSRSQMHPKHADRSGRPALEGPKPPPRDKRAPKREAPAPVALPTPISTSVQTVTASADESGMRLDRFFEARFPGLSFSHIQRIIRKGEVRLNGKRADTKDWLQVGQQVRIPPLKLSAPKTARLTPDDEKTRDF